MKKTLLIITFIFLLSIVSCSDNTKEFKTEYIVEDRYNLSNNPEELIEVSDLIVLAKVLPNKVNYNNPSYTKTELEILNTLKGDNEPGNIFITEEYYISNSTIFTQEFYEPSLEGETYIFFLKKYSNDVIPFNGMYFPIDLEYGKYRFFQNLEYNDICELSEVELNLSPDVDRLKYLDWYKVVFELYEESISNFKK